MSTTKQPKRWFAGLAAVALIVTLFAVPVTAQNPESAEARKAYDEAQQKLGREDYRAAARAFHEFRASNKDSYLAASAAYWEAFSLYRLGGTSRLEEARQLLLEASELYGDESAADRKELLARIEGSLARRGDAEAAEEIQRRSEDNADEAVRIAALNALMNMDSDRALPILERLVKDPEQSPELREQAVFLIAQQDGPRVSEILLDIVHNDPSKPVRGAAIFWLGQHGGDQAVDALEEVLRNETDPELLERTMFSLAQSGSHRARELLVEVASNMALDVETRGHAIFWLGQEGGDETLDFLKQLYPQVDDPEVKEKLLFSVSQIGDRGTSAWLLGIARDPDEDHELRKKALFWAGQTGELRPQEMVEIYRNTEDPEMKEQVIFVLAQDESPQALDVLLDLAQNESDMELRTKAIFWLGQSEDPRAVELLGELIER